MVSFALLAISAAVASATGNPFAPKSHNTGKSAYINKLINGAKVIRGLEENGDQQQYQVDISSYSVKFEKCQFVKSHDDDDDLSNDEATKRFVIFRLCPNNSCSSCTHGYGEYIVDLASYLATTVQYRQQMQEAMCSACTECGKWNDPQGDDQANQDDANRKLEEQFQYYDVDCDTCSDECMKIENMEKNGYIDATNFLQCQMIYAPDDDGKSILYAAPICASQGSKIKIGVFSDENCYFIDSSKHINDYLMNDDGYAMKLSHALLRTVYSSDSCISCEAQSGNSDNGNGDRDQEAVVLEMCRELYQAAAKCEQAHGFDNGFDNYDEYENQEANEDVVCDFIDSIGAGRYDENGEIVVNGSV